VTGASGSIGAALVPRLLADGHEVRAAGRSTARLREALGEGPAAAELRSVDVDDGRGLAAALREVQVGYYLVHSMERSANGEDFALREQRGARNFAVAARRAGVQRIVYLGGLLPADGISPHLASRRSVELALRDGAPECIALRASIVVSARSRSFRLLVRLVERMPLLALPAWQRFRTRPIDGRDVVEMLVAAASAPDLPEKLDIAGPDVLSYGEILSEIADLMLIERPSLALPVNLTQYTARIAAAIAGEQPELVLPLMQGLQVDLLPAEDRADELLGVRLHSFRAAVERALRDWEGSELLAAR